MQSELEIARKEARSMYDGADRGRYIGEEQVRGTTYYFYYNGKEYLYETDYDREQEEKRRKRDEERRKRLRREGMAYALRVAKEKGIEALESDMKARGILELPLAMKSYDGMRELYNMLAMRIVSTIKTTTLWTLYDKYGWRKKRIGDFERELNEVCAACLELDRFGGNYVKVSDYAAELKETCDVDLNFEILSQIDEENTKARGQYISVEAVAEILRNAGLDEVADEIIRKVEENR